MSLLLKIYEKEIYKQYGCSTIYEYGFKYAKLSKETVKLALRTLKNTEDKPFLREKIETQGIYKVSIVAKLATPETDKIYAEHVENMSKPVLFEFAKEMRNAEENRQHQEKSQEELLENSSEKYLIKCHAVIPKMTIELDEEMQILFNQLKKKYAKDLSNKEALKIILKNISNAQKNIPGNGISKISKAKTIQKTHNNQKNSDASLPSRYVLVQRKREIDQKTDGKCYYPNCTRPIENLHHPIPFSFNRSHESVIGLCKIHHAFCHNGIIKNELKEPSKWELNLAPQRSLFDDLYNKYRAVL